jgi:phosphomannomutase
MSTADRAEQWLQLDPDPDTRAELEALIVAGGPDLDERFAGRLEFGTAGLRGALGAGPTRMNRVVVRQATAGVAARLAREGDPGATIVVVGRDARYKSDVFAQDAVAVLARAGFDVRYWSDPVPTPLLAYATRLLGAGAGIQVTASHNPANDNGYKVYWWGGGQITPDLADEIAAAISSTPTPADHDPHAGRPHADHLIDAYRAPARSLLPPGGGRVRTIV